MKLKDCKIVVIDDTPSIRTFLHVSLKDEGAQFYGAPTAKEGLDLCKKVIPDLVVLDLGLPDVDGLDILPQIKATQPGNYPSIIILTVRKDKATIREAYQKGADAYLTKPFVVDDLLKVIEEKL